MNRITIRVHPVQQAFLDSLALYRGFVGGRGSGKTWIGALDLLLRAMAAIGLFALYAPTYAMLRDSSWRTLLDLGKMLRVVRDVNRSELRLTLGNGSEIICRSTDEPERARGLNLSGAWLDEASLIPRDAYDIVIASLREKGRQGWLSATFTPRGKQHWTYQVFGTPRQDVALFHARTGDNPFLPDGFVDIIRAQYPSSFAAQELDGQFVDPPGNLFKREWFSKFVPVPPSQVEVRVRYWDRAATAGDGDYTVGVRMSRADGVYYIEDVVRGQWSPGERDRVIKQCAELDPPETHIWLEQEPGSSGVDSVQALIRMLAGHAVYADKVTGNKRYRAEPFAAQCEAGNVILVKGPWNQAYLDELVSFPDGEHDDQVDASSGAFSHVALPRTASFMESFWR